MPTIGEPWPPADPGPPLEYDHVGCCGPRDTCGRFRPVPLRVDVDGYSPNYIVNSAWLWIRDGQLLRADPTLWTWAAARWVGAAPPIAATNIMVIEPHHSLPGHMVVDATFYLDLLGLLFVTARGVVTPDYCSGTFDVPVIQAVGPPNPPELLAVDLLQWYHAARYAYFGT